MSGLAFYLSLEHSYLFAECKHHLQADIDAKLVVYVEDEARRGSDHAASGPLGGRGPVLRRMACAPLFPLTVPPTCFHPGGQGRGARRAAPPHVAAAQPGADAARFRALGGGSRGRARGRLAREKWRNPSRPPPGPAACVSCHAWAARAPVRAVSRPSPRPLPAHVGHCPSTAALLHHRPRCLPTLSAASSRESATAG